MGFIFPVSKRATLSTLIFHFFTFSFKMDPKIINLSKIYFFAQKALVCLHTIVRKLLINLNGLKTPDTSVLKRGYQVVYDFRYFLCMLVVISTLGACFLILQPTIYAFGTWKALAWWTKWWIFNKRLADTAGKFICLRLIHKLSYFNFLLLVNFNLLSKL